MSKQGGVTTPLFSCVFNLDGTITHHSHEAIPELLAQLENTYVVCVRDNAGSSPGMVVGGFIVKTSYHHGEEEFLDALSGVLSQLPYLQEFVAPDTSLLPAKLGVAPGWVLSEDEMLQVLFKQYMRFSASTSV